MFGAHFFSADMLILAFFFVLQGFSERSETPAAILFQDFLDSFSTVLLSVSFIVALVGANAAGMAVAPSLAGAILSEDPRSGG